MGDREEKETGCFAWFIVWQEGWEKKEQWREEGKVSQGLGKKSLSCFRGKRNEWAAILLVRQTERGVNKKGKVLFGCKLCALHVFLGVFTCSLPLSLRLEEHASFLRFTPNRASIV